MLWFLVVLFSIIIVLGYALKTYLSGNVKYLTKHGIPHVMVSSNEMGSFWDWINLRIPIHALDMMVYKKLKSLGKSVRFGGIMVLRRPFIYLTDLDLIRLLTVKDFEHFTNHGPPARKKEPFVYQMMFFTNNADWKSLRAALSPVFTTAKIRRVFEIFNESGRKMRTYLTDEAKKLGPDGIDICDACGRYALDVILAAGFGVDSQNFEDKNSTFATMGGMLQEHMSGIISSIRFYSSNFAPGIYRLLGFKFLDPTSIKFFSKVIRKMIHHNEETEEKRHDLIQLILEAKEENLNGNENSEKRLKVNWTEDLIVAQCIAFLFAAFDTIKSLLIFAAYELALNPDIQEQLFEEVKNAEEENGELTYEVVNQLEFMDQVISETLRKYPPAPRSDRKCTKNYRVLGSTIEIQKDMVLTIPIYAIHHDPEIYPEPEKFIPSRFTSQEKAKRHQYAYLPFGAGPRNCIATRFALTEGKTAIAQFVRHFHLEPSTRTIIPMEFQVSLVLKPSDRIWLKVTPRD